jgi:hypothetical protein
MKLRVAIETESKPEGSNERALASVAGELGA